MRRGAIVALAATLLLAMAAPFYVIGYRRCGDRSYVPTISIRGVVECRTVVFGTVWQAWFWLPAAWGEARCVGCSVRIGYCGDLRLEYLTEVGDDA